MKKFYVLTLMALTIPISANAQFYEDFENVVVNPADTGLFLTGDIPTNQGWALYDQDGNTPAPQRSYIDEAWIVASLDGRNKYALSTSFYVPPGQSNDWMVTPQINVPTDNPYLIFKAKVLDENYADDYEILVSTTGNAPSDFSTLIYSDYSPPENFETVRVSLSNYAGEQVYIAFRNVAYHELLLAIDDISVREMVNRDIAITDLKLSKEYTAVNTNSELKITVKNVGFNVINTVDLSWSDGSNTYTQQLSGLNLQPWSSTTITHSTPVSAASVAEIPVVVSASNVNGSNDGNLSNNTQTIYFHTVAPGATKHVVIEAGSDTSCGECPRGIAVMNYMYENAPSYRNFIGIFAHAGDPMRILEYVISAKLYIPEYSVGREVNSSAVSKSNWIDYYNERKNNLAVADISINAIYDTDTRKINASLTTTYYTDFTAPHQLRLAMIVVKNDVTGMGADFAQSNIFSGNAQGPGDFENKPNPIPASQMSYDRVATVLLGGYFGVINSVPGGISKGNNTTYNFVYTLPQDQNPAKIHLVALLIDQTTGEILNANDLALNSVLGIERKAPEVFNRVKVYPNPAAKKLYVNFGTSNPVEVFATIYSMSGTVVQSENFKKGTGNQQIELDVSSLATGEYFLSLSTKKGAVIKTIIVE